MYLHKVKMADRDIHLLQAIHNEDIVCKVSEKIIILLNFLAIENYSISSIQYRKTNTKNIPMIKKNLITF